MKIDNMEGIFPILKSINFTINALIYAFFLYAFVVVRGDQIVYNHTRVFSSNMCAKQGKKKELKNDQKVCIPI
jgi:hypothetical protein